MVTGAETPGRRQQSGLAYLALLAAVAVMGMVAAHTVQQGAAQAQHALEEELVFIGEQFRVALDRYARATPAGTARAPRELEDLLRDPRRPAVVRHLRQLYADPMTGRADWEPVRDAQGLILGVHSRSSRKPLRLQGPPGQLPPGDGGWQSYREWVFWGPLAAVPRATPTAPGPEPRQP